MRYRQAETDKEQILRNKLEKETHTCTKKKKKKKKKRQKNMKENRPFYMWRHQHHPLCDGRFCDHALVVTQYGSCQIQQPACLYDKTIQLILIKTGRANAQPIHVWHAYSTSFPVFFLMSSTTAKVLDTSYPLVHNRIALLWPCETEWR